MEVSKKHELIYTDLKNILRNALVSFSPVIIAMLTMLQNGENVDIRILFAIAIWILLDAYRRFVKDYTK